MAVADEISSYLKLVGSQYSSKPVFMALLRRYLEAVDAATQIALKIPSAFDVAKATGKQLDTIGSLVGVSRDYPSLEDESSEGSSLTIARMDDKTYRIVILARIMSNSWDGRYGSFAENWNATLGSMGVNAVYNDCTTYSEAAIMTGNVYVRANDDDFTAEQQKLMSANLLFPKTMGVNVKYSVSGADISKATVMAYAGVTKAMKTMMITAE